MSEQEAVELKVYIDNDNRLYRQYHQPISKNLALKKAKGTYVHDKAHKAFMYLVDAGAKDYIKEHGSMGDKWNKVFDLQTRKTLADMYVQEFETEYRLGNYVHLLPLKHQPKNKNEARRIASKRAALAEYYETTK